MLRSAKAPIVQFGVQSSQRVIRSVRLIDRLVLRYSSYFVTGLIGLSAYFRFFRDSTGSDLIASQLCMLLSALLLAYATVNLETFRRP